MTLEKARTCGYCDEKLVTVGEGVLDGIDVPVGVLVFVGVED